MKFIENKEELGLLYNFKKIQKEYDKLEIPSHYFRPPFNEIENHKYFIELSERRTGKTTNWLLLGMVMNKLYDTRIIYVRQTLDMIAPKYANEIFNVITSWNDGEYIKKLTNNLYNSIKYNRRQFYYCHVDGEGKVTSIADKPFMHVVSIDNGQNLKSTFNVPTGDLILFDEFISRRYRPNEAVEFFDLCSTIIRGRLSPIIVMLANTINLNNEYFYELEIANKIKDMGYGDKRTVVTERGTRLFVEIIKIMDTVEQDKRRIHANKFFGFKNPQLTSIVGGDEVWAFEHVPHIIKYAKDGHEIEKHKIPHTPIYIRHYGELLRLWFIETEELGTFIEVTRATYMSEQSLHYIFVDDREEYLKYNEFKSLGRGTKLFKTIAKYVTLGKIYFQNNEIGNIFMKYLEEC